MSSPTFTPCTDASALRSAIAPWLATDPAPFAVINGIAERLAGGADWCGVIRVAGEPRLALAQTSQHAVLIASPGPVEAACVACAAALIRARSTTVTGVSGPDAWAEAIVAALGIAVCDRMGLRLHRLVGDPRLPRPVAGQLRTFRPEEDDLLWDWHLAFGREVEPGAPDPHRDPAAMAGVHGESFAWAVDGQPVSMARRRRPLLGGWTISGVYTPPALRGRGYAAAAVQALSATLLAEGASYVVLYTDRTNPISNRLYARIGFVPCLDETRLSWNPS
jgi:RimJ/RimL family protein N-acetyltransferase